MLREYKESTRGARAAKREGLDAWWSGEQRRRAVRARAMRGLRALDKALVRERKRLRDAMADAVVGSQIDLWNQVANHFCPKTCPSAAP